jgi:pimeloyl-ACP methyl ester carboxylesterase
MEEAMSELPGLPAEVLPPGVRARFVGGVNGLRVHLLEAGFETKGRPLALLLHGFPGLAYSWRKVMQPLAEAGYHVVAPDQRGYGRTTGWDADYDGDLASFRMLNLARDVLGLVFALGYRSVAGVIGHDFGASVAAWCALTRPDVFRSVAVMSGPFAGAPTVPFGAVAPLEARGADIHGALAQLDRPRKHYQWYYSTRAANHDMHGAPQGVHDFLRAYFHYKSADWAGNQPFRLAAWSAPELAKMPTYYIMDFDKGMAATVAAEMPSGAQIAACRWLPDDELRVYSGEYERTGFQGGLQWYRCRTEGVLNGELELFSGRTIDIPSMFVAGKSDWGTFQSPGNIERMKTTACTNMVGCHLVNGAGHWVQQEQPATVAALLQDLLSRA